MKITKEEVDSILSEAAMDLLTCDEVPTLFVIAFVKQCRKEKGLFI